jgi:hypothetical protein
VEGEYAHHESRIGMRWKSCLNRLHVVEGSLNIPPDHEIDMHAASNAMHRTRPDLRLLIYCADLKTKVARVVTIEGQPVAFASGSNTVHMGHTYRQKI